MTETTKPTVIEALSAVMEDVQAVKKSGRNTQQNYNFRGIDAVVNAVGPVLRKHGVVVVPIAASVVSEHYTTKSGTPMKGVTATVTYRWFGPAGDSIDAEACGEASDSGDKAVPKAHSVAYRTMLLQALCIPTDEPDPDEASHERGFTAPERVADPHGLQSSRADSVQDNDPAYVRVHFGKNANERVGDLPKRSREWYAGDGWAEKAAESGRPIADADHRLRRAARLLSGLPVPETEGPFAQSASEPVPADDEIPF